MGLGWVVARKNDNSIENISFSSRLADWPSSTRAELGAIWTALLAASCNTKINIFIDSKVVIESLQNNRSINSLWELFKTKNYSLINRLRTVARLKN